MLGQDRRNILGRPVYVGKTANYIRNRLAHLVRRYECLRQLSTNINPTQQDHVDSNDDAERYSQFSEALDVAASACNYTQAFLQNTMIEIASHREHVGYVIGFEDALMYLEYHAEPYLKPLGSWYRVYFQSFGGTCEVDWSKDWDFLVSNIDTTSTGPSAFNELFDIAPLSLDKRVPLNDGHSSHGSSSLAMSISSGLDPIVTPAGNTNKARSKRRSKETSSPKSSKKRRSPDTEEAEQDQLPTAIARKKLKVAKDLVTPRENAGSDNSASIKCRSTGSASTKTPAVAAKASSGSAKTPVTARKKSQSSVSSLEATHRSTRTPKPPVRYADEF